MLKTMMRHLKRAAFRTDVDFPPPAPGIGERFGGGDAIGRNHSFCRDALGADTSALERRARRLIPSPNRPPYADAGGDTAPRPPFGKGGQGGFCFFILLALFFLGACQTPPRFTVEALPAYDAAFERPSGWTGGDGAHTVALDRGRVLWLFGDTFIGRVQDGRRVGSQLVNNSVAVQSGALPSDASLHFVLRTLPDGRPLAFLQPADGVGWLWPYHGVRTSEGLFLFLLQIERAEGPAGFGFKLVSTWLGKVANPDEAPEAWAVTQQKIPWGRPGRVFGSAVLARGDDCYVYGTVDAVVEGRVRKRVIVARVPADRLEDFGSWRFFAGGGWTADADRAEAVCEDVAGEFSVSYQPALDRYVLVYTEGGLSEHIALRFARRPQGPWGEPVRVYRCPEADWGPRIFCYAGKGHPEIGDGPQELIVTYVANATDLALLEADARLYRPRFVKITFADGAFD